IMHNALKLNQVSRMAQVCIRDVSHAEMEFAERDGRIIQFSDFAVSNHLFAGGNWFELSRDIVNCLPQKVYISFDIDGLDPSCCPNTGTPVAGGISPDAAMYLIRMVAESGREIIGADLCEVAPGTDEWDAGNGARILYRTAVLIQHSHQPTIA
ncbi:MAG: arginase family protein, partial [Bacteroidales bacterium]